MNFFKFLLVLLAIIMILIGAVTAISPVPVGLPLIMIGFMILATASPATLRFLRRRWGWLDRRLRWLQKKLPRYMTHALRRSDPHPEKENEDESEENIQAEERTAHCRAQGEERPIARWKQLRN